MGDPVSRHRPLLGRVTAFDPDRALGTVEGDDGRSLDFHSTAIADGSRTIDRGARVAYLVRAGTRGRPEAYGLVVVSGG
jgi:cold shock CspA family protein